MNKKGFTLVEVLSVLVLIGLLMSIAGLGITNAQKKAKQKILASKVNNIEKTAVLWGQKNKGKLTGNCTYNEKNYSSCNEITVQTLIQEKYLDGEENSSNITNPLDDTKFLNQCKIYVYMKYEKVYAIYDRSHNMQCWK